MTRRITGNDLRAYAAGHFPEPYGPTMGQPHYYEVIATLVNQIGHWTKVAEEAGNAPDKRSALRTRWGVEISLGEILSTRSQQRPESSDTAVQWNQLCAFRANGYRGWAKELLERET